MYMIRLTNLIKEIGIDGFFNDKIALSFPSVIAKDIKKIVTNRTWTHMLKWPYERVK